MDNGTTVLHHNIGSTYACRYDRRPDALYVLMTYLDVSSSDRINVNKAYYIIFIYLMLILESTGPVVQAI